MFKNQKYFFLQSLVLNCENKLLVEILMLIKYWGLRSTKEVFSKRKFYFKFVLWQAIVYLTVFTFNFFSLSVKFCINLLKKGFFRNEKRLL